MSDHLTSARAVANYFLDRSFEENIDIDQLKLQKLVYYAYAWYMGNREKELFTEDILAWEHGPVIEDLWKEFKHFGRKPIDRKASEIAVVDKEDGGMELQFRVPEIDEDDEDTVNLLKAIWNNYKKYTGIQLSNMTNATDEPWSIVKGSVSLSTRPKIPDDIIKKSFRKKVEEAKPGEDE